MKELLKTLKQLKKKNEKVAFYIDGWKLYIYKLKNHEDLYNGSLPDFIEKILALYDVQNDNM